MSKNKLDAIDLQILEALQGDGRMSNVDLASHVGISPPPCLRRVRALQEAGYLQGYHGIVDQNALGFDLTAFAMVGLHSQAEADLVAFEQACEGWPFVRQCHMLNGEIDFLLKCVAPDLPTFQHFITNDLTAAENVASVKTTLVIRSAKHEPGVPFEALGADTGN